MNNTSGASWDLAGLYPPPFDLRLTDGIGRVAIAK
jgi:hypothetical protein